MKERPILFSTPMVQAILEGRKTMTRRIMKPQPEIIDIEKITSWENTIPVCKYGNPGEVLWVRETWFNDCIEKKDDPAWVYKADNPDYPLGSDHWMPSIFMPKAACRLRLLIKSIRVERLQDITEEDAIAEGAKDSIKVDDMNLLKGLDWIIPRPFLMHQFGFLAIWCKINGIKSWEANPWVWVIEFEKM